MKLFLSCFVTLFFYSTTFFGQTFYQQNIITDDYTYFKGTKISIIKPDSTFKLTSDNSGLESKRLNAGIIVAKISMPYDLVLPMLTKDIPTEEGKILLEQKIKINDLSGEIYKIIDSKSRITLKENKPENQLSGRINWIMILGNSKFCINVVAVYPRSQDGKLSDKIEFALKSIVYEEDKIVDLQDGLLYSLDLENSPLKFASLSFQTGAFYNLNGKDHYAEDPKNENTLVLMVTEMPFAVEDENQRQAAIDKVKNSANPKMEIKEVNELSVNGITGYEVLGFDKSKDGQLKLSYTTSYYTADKHYTLKGIIKDDVEQNLKNLKEIVRTFNLK